MQNKLQELTDKLYNEGLSKGKQEGEEILAKAKAQAEEIIAKAQAEAAQILAAAQKQAEEVKTKTASDVKMAASQSIAATRKDIETLIVGKMTDEAVKKALSTPDFTRQNRWQCHMEKGIQPTRPQILCRFQHGFIKFLKPSEDNHGHIT